MKLSSLWLFTLLVLWIYPRPIFSEDLEKTPPTPPPIDKEAQRHLHYSISLGLGYQSFILYEQHHRAMESFLAFNLQAAYYPTSFLSLSYTFGAGAFSYYNVDGIPQNNQIYFPTSVSRFDIENTISLEFYGLMNSSSLMFLGVGGSYLYMGNLNQENTESTSNYSGTTERHVFSLNISLGSRFALYDHTIMEAKLYVMLPFVKTRSWSLQGPKAYKQIILGFMMGIGFFD